MALYGVQTGIVATAFVKFTPSVASLSRFGVRTSELPAYPVASARHWSANTKTIFGFFAAGLQEISKVEMLNKTIKFFIIIIF
jgi:hypothetical protein